VQLFKPMDGSGAIVGVVGALQLDVLKSRLDAEYGVPVEFENTRFEVLRWLFAESSNTLNGFVDANKSAIAHDLDGAPVMLASSLFNLNYALERAPGIKVATIKEIHG
jgi:peptide chain release factor 3